MQCDSDGKTWWHKEERDSNGGLDCFPQPKSYSFSITPLTELCSFLPLLERMDLRTMDGTMDDVFADYT